MSNELGSIKTGVGLGGGIPIKDLVEQSVNQVFDPKKERIGIQELEVQAKITSLGKLKSKLSELQNAAKKVACANDLLGKTAKVANNPALTNPSSTYLQVTASDCAQVGNYQITVDQLAVSDKYTTGTDQSNLYGTDTAIIGTGTLNFTLGAGQPNARTFQIVVDNQNNNNTLGGICRLINKQTSTTGVAATLINTDKGYFMSIGSNLSGLPSTLNITVTDDNGSGLQTLSSANLTHSSTALNALIHIDNAPVTLTSNHAVNVIQGLTFDLYQVTGGLANTLEINNDTSQAFDRIKDFVEKYNSVIDFMSKVTRRKDDKNNVYDHQYQEDDDGKAESNGKPLDKNEKKKRDYTINQKTGNGIFIGDSTILTLRTALTKAISTKVNQLQYSSVTHLGILSNRKTGKLEINEDTLKGAISQNPTNVTNLFTANVASGAPSNGVGPNFNILLDSYISLPKGRVMKETLSLSDKLRTIAVQRLKIEKDMAQMEFNLTKKYANLDRAVAKQRNIENSLMQSLDAMHQHEKK